MINGPTFILKMKSSCLINNVGLYSGLGWLTLGRTLGVGARFGVYEILTAFYRGIPLSYPLLFLSFVTIFLVFT